MLKTQKTASSSAVSTFRLRGVGKATAALLARLQIFSPADLLFHLPSRYQDRTHIEPMRMLRPGRDAVVQGVITRVTLPTRGRTKLLCECRDQTGVIQLRFFHVLSFQSSVLREGNEVRCYGEVRFGPQGYEMSHPEFQLIVPEKPLPIDDHLTPIYPATEGLSQHMLRKLMGSALEWMATCDEMKELLPAELLAVYQLPTLKAALQCVHRPSRETPLTELADVKTPAQQRLIFEELLAHRLSLLQVKQSFQSQHSIPLVDNNGLTARFLAQLPFQLTAAQTRVAEEVACDLARDKPMLRLVQGDVGSGKTVIAALAMLRAVENGHQAALMAPTELLAEQHQRNFHRWFEPLGVRVVFLSGSVKSRARTAALQAIASGEAQIIIGTHALFQEAVNFSRLALVVIDEQHRFGVHQRALLREKGIQSETFPHQLIMTATPIPRTLAMSFYADLDCSVIDELPPGRTPIVTTVMAGDRRDEVVERIRKACNEGRQVYWVCPLIDESEVINCQAATTTAESLQSQLTGLKVGLIHGRMRAEEKERAMRAFQQAETQVLVATTVIEVGVDVPNASVMIIENAERLGLSQLHQLRGRVGRGGVASYCVLLYQNPLSMMSKERLTVMRESTDGFHIAQRDLELRGPGEVLGTRQTGELSFRVADLLRDKSMLRGVQEIADRIINDYPDLIAPLVLRWMGARSHYGEV